MRRKRLVQLSVLSFILAIILFVAAGALLSRYYENEAGAINICAMLGVLTMVVSLATAVAAFIRRG